MNEEKLINLAEEFIKVFMRNKQKFSAEAVITYNWYEREGEGWCCRFYAQLPDTNRWVLYEGNTTRVRRKIKSMRDERTT